MGCDIHMITQIRKDKKWKYIPETPETFNCRNYTAFAFLASVRGYCPMGFMPKGLPDDLDQKQYKFDSEMDWLKNQYSNGSALTHQNEDGTYSKPLRADEDLVDVRYNKLYSSFEDFLKDVPERYGMDQCGDEYGYFGVDFTSSDYHSHSWLTLEEIQERLKKAAPSEDPIIVPTRFFDVFFDLGGEIPYEMDLVYNNDTVLVTWGSPIEGYGMLMQGCQEMEEIAKKYGVSPEDLRIVFAFDS